MHEILEDADRKMRHAVEVTAHDFGRIRTGRANPQVLEAVKVDYYGTESPVNQVATIAVPEPRQLQITPFDKSMLAVIERAIMNSDLNMTPNNDGICIRLNFPTMTEERRKDMVKQVAQRAEEGCVAIRNVRHHALNTMRDLKKDKLISEDEEKSLEKKLQELTDKYIAETHVVQKKKEVEVMEI